MAKIVIVTPQKNRPMWLLSVLALFPFDIRKEYPDQDADGILSAVVHYLRDFTYKRRNATQRLETTHSIGRSEDRITVSTINGNTYLIIQIIKEQ